MIQPVKTIVVKGDEVFVSLMDEPKIDEFVDRMEFNEQERHSSSTKFKYNNALIKFNATLIKVENTNTLCDILFHYDETTAFLVFEAKREGSIKAPDGLMMDVKEGTTPEGYYKFAMCSFNAPVREPSEEENKQIDELIAKLPEHELAEAEFEKNRGWISVKDRLPGHGIEVIGYSKQWIHPDFNLKGIRACFIGGDDKWISAKWNNDQDSWHTHAEWKCPDGKDFEPTHWMLQPEPPKE